MERGKKAQEPPAVLQDWKVIKEKMGVFKELITGTDKPGDA